MTCRASKGGLFSAWVGAKLEKSSLLKSSCRIDPVHLDICYCYFGRSMKLCLIVSGSEPGNAVYFTVKGFEGYLKGWVKVFWANGSRKPFCVQKDCRIGPHQTFEGVRQCLDCK